jgi:2-dehydro-3-deoxyphosphogluconate aldolase/(4S)-4-hydroxy-2-oxoglutarate aldolase
MVSDAQLLDTLREQRIVAIIRGQERDAVVRTGLTLVECGIGCLEVSLTAREALDAIADLAGKVADGALVGAGTVLSHDDARRARDAGARFAVTPGLGDGVDGAITAGLPVLGGAFTATEVVAARARCAAVKLFPASLGGPEYLRALRAPFPDVAFVPVGGVELAAVSGYLAAGAVAVGVGSPLVGDAADGGSLCALRDRAQALLLATRR